LLVEHQKISRLRRISAVRAVREAATLKAGEVQAMYAKAAHDYVGYWRIWRRADIDWHRPFTVSLDDARAPNYRWFADGS